MLTTQDPAKAHRAVILRNHGSEPKYYHREIGGNFRLDALQAAVVTIKLKYLDGWTAARQANAARYRRLFAGTGLEAAGKIVLPEARTTRHIYNQFVIRAENRDGLLAHLRMGDVGTEIYYPVPLHLQDCFRSLGHHPGDFPESEKAAKTTLALPIYPELTDEMAARVVECIEAFYK